MSVTGVAISSPSAVGSPPSARAQKAAQTAPDRSEMPYVSPVLRVDIDQGGPVMAYRDRQTGEVTEQRSARLESAQDNGQADALSRDSIDPNDGGATASDAPSADRAEAASSAYQESASRGEPVRPTNLSFEA